jgi:hypothetical protein
MDEAAVIREATKIGNNIRRRMWIGKTALGILHLFTIYTAYRVDGLFMAIVSTFFAGVAEVFYFVRLWSGLHTVVNLYTCVAAVCLLVYWLTMMRLDALIARLGELERIAEAQEAAGVNEYVVEPV